VGIRERGTIPKKGLLIISQKLLGLTKNCNEKIGFLIEIFNFSRIISHYNVFYELINLEYTLSFFLVTKGDVAHILPW